jgi:hypothetical protein
LSSKKVEHAGNKSGVIKKLVIGSGVPNFENSIGMVDEDPLSNRNPYLDKFAEPKRLNKVKINVLYYRWLNNNLIVLCPRLEEWIIEAAREAQICPGDYDLPDSGVALHQVINLKTDRFEDMVRSLRRRSARVKELRRLLNELPVDRRRK